MTPVDSDAFAERSLLGLRFFDVSLEGLLDLVVVWAKERRSKMIVTCNVDHVMLLRRSPGFPAAYARADVITADGAPIVRLSRLVGQPLRERVTGADLVLRLPKIAAKNELRLAFVGGADGVAAEAARIVKRRHPAIELPSSFCPPMGFRIGSAEDQRVVDEVRAADPHIVIVCLGAPKQELWMAAHRDELPGAVMIGAGAALDFIVGTQKRAPLWMQRNGLEWTWRLAHDFPRMSRRYLIQDSGFIPIAVREILAQRRTRATGTAGQP